jgi:hypothetical protein
VVSPPAPLLLALALPLAGALADALVAGLALDPVVVVFVVPQPASTSTAINKKILKRVMFCSFL